MFNESFNSQATLSPGIVTINPQQSFTETVSTGTQTDLLVFKLTSAIRYHVRQIIDLVEIAGVETIMNINDSESSLTEEDLHPAILAESATVTESGTRTIGTQSIANPFNRTLQMVNCLAQETLIELDRMTEIEPCEGSVCKKQKIL